MRPDIPDGDRSRTLRIDTADRVDSGKRVRYGSVRRMDDGRHDVESGMSQKIERKTNVYRLYFRY